MSTLYLLEQYSYLKKEGETVKLVKDKSIICQVPLIKFDKIIVQGNITITQPLIEELVQKGIDIHYTTYNGKYISSVLSSASKNLFVRKAQYQKQFADEEKLKLAISFIQGKVYNQRVYLSRFQRNNNDQYLDNIIYYIKNLEKNIIKSKDIAELMGYEGIIAAQYFEGLSIILKNSMNFNNRNKRPPKDPVNCMLSYGYSLLLNEMITALNIVGFDPYLGFLHSDEYGRPSLALDIMEEFRTVIVDSMVVYLVNKHILKESDFDMDENMCLFKEEAKKKYLKKYDDKKKTEIVHPFFGYQTMYKNCFELQARLLAKYMTGEMDNYIPFKMK